MSFFLCLDFLKLFPWNVRSSKCTTTTFNLFSSGKIVRGVKHSLYFYISCNVSDNLHFIVHVAIYSLMMKKKRPLRIIRGYTTDTSFSSYYALMV